MATSISHIRYLLLDEPTSALDLALSARQFAQAERVGVLAILHDLNLAELYANRIAILQSGKLVAVDAPSKVLNEQFIEQVFDYFIVVHNHP